LLDLVPLLYIVHHTDTTRAPRQGEVDGKDYHFVSREAFCALVRDGAFIEHAEFSANLYGTSLAAVKSIQDQGRRCILDIEAQGVRQIKKTNLNPVYLFLSPPSLQELRVRLEKRATDTPASIHRRLETATKEIQFAQSGAHDVIIINRELEGCYAKFQQVALGSEVESDALPDPPLL